MRFAVHDQRPKRRKGGQSVKVTLAKTSASPRHRFVEGMHLRTALAIKLASAPRISYALQKMNPACFFRFLSFLALIVAAPALGQVTLAPLVGFGGADGWLAPGDSATDFVNGSGSTERGLAYNPVTNHLLLTSRTGTPAQNVRIMDSLTGADLGGLNVPTSIVTGGTFIINQVEVAADGAIYVANLASPGATVPFKIYRWSDELPATAPTVAFNATNSPSNARLGDDLDLIGSGAGTVIVVGESTSGTNTGNGYVVYGSANGTTYTGTKVTFPLSPAPGGTINGEFNRGLTFLDDSTSVAGKNTNTSLLRLTSYDPATGTGSLLSSPAAIGSMLEYAVVGGVPLLATLNMASTTAGAEAASIVRLYDLTDRANPLLLATGDLTTTTITAGGAVGSLAWGQISGPTATLYALSVNNGIQAFTVTIPEPSSAALLALSVIGLGCRPRRYSRV